MANYLNNFVVHTATILSGQTTSDAIDLQGRPLVGMILPAAFTGSTITFTISVDNSTFTAVYNTANTQLSVTVTQGRAYLFSPGDLVGVRYLKLVSGSSEGADRSITLISRELA
jgi:hypothetical protein